VGILLIFLIFVMLAAARKNEMGMARAVGARRRHLVLMFLFEGTAYAVLAAAIGVGLGLLVSAAMTTILNEIFMSFDDSFQLSIHFEPRSVVVTYCLGMMIVFATVAVSAYRVSLLNIVIAIRGLPEAIIPKEAASLRERLPALGR
jgi:putative ABC transport system permease protein